LDSLFNTAETSGHFFMKIRYQSIILWVILLSAVVCVWGFPARVSAQVFDRIVVGDFSSGVQEDGLPAGWQPLFFDKIPQHTHYEMVRDNSVIVLRAQSSSAASCLIRKIDIDPLEYPIVEWRWKVAGVLKKGDARQKKGDDYAARIYISFAYDPSLLTFVERIKYKVAKLLYGEYPPSAVLNYIWGNRVPANTMIPSPYTDRSMMFVVQSGDHLARQWVQEERNILLDFREAFDAEPPMITGVAIMTDSDNTGETATAWYGDIIFRKK
jgi:hypothetical protein